MIGVCFSDLDKEVAIYERSTAEGSNVVNAERRTPSSYTRRKDQYRITS